MKAAGRVIMRGEQERGRAEWEEGNKDSKKKNEASHKGDKEGDNQ